MAGTAAVAQKNSVSEQTVTMKTYPYSDPNPLPTMAINAKVSSFYPYNVFDGYTDKGVDQPWKVVSMENPYIRVTVLPQVGGKVMGATEKSTGKEFVYTNHVMKFRSIGIRGPWTSGGIEHNYGLDLGHAPWAAGPVDYEIVENADGSTSCIVGGLDLASRSQWRMDIRLPRDKAYFETRGLWYNPTPLHGAYLSWENAAFKATQDLQFYFPGDAYIGHNGEASAWPIDEQGRNLSLYKENDFGGHKSYHVMGNARNWFGGYWHDTQFGFGHWAPYADAPGKKIWIWSLSRNGAIWEDLLTDNDGQYIEAQAGVKFNQASEKSGFHSPFMQLSLRPYYSETKTDYWFPVKATGGMADASPTGTLNVTASGSNLNISISPNVEIHDSLKVTVKGRVVHSELLDLDPLEVFEKTVAVPGSDDFTVTVGKDKLLYSTDTSEYLINRPVVNTFEKESRSAERFFRLGEDENAMRNYDNAAGYYLQCLEMEPTHSQALTRLAELSYRKGHYDEGIDYARRVLQLNTYDGGANFIYGVLLRATGQLVDAEEAFSVAARTMEYRSAAYLQMAAVNMEKRLYDNVILYGKRSLDFNRYNLDAYHLLATAYRKSDQPQQAHETVRELLSIDPLSHYARFEKYLLQPTEQNLSVFKSAIKNEFPQETYLELATAYVREGNRGEAIKVLEQAPEYPTVYYWLAYLLKDQAESKSSEYLKQAVSLSPERVFPFRAETIPVLTWAQKQAPHWKSQYYLGLIYWSQANSDKAKELFLACGNTPDYSTFYLTRSILLQQDKGQEAAAVRDINRALELDQHEWRNWHYLNDWQLSKNDFKNGLETATKAFKLFPANPVIRMDYAKSLLYSGDTKTCLKVLDETTVLPQEGAREGHDIYELANLAAAVNLMKDKKYRKALPYIEASREWPENLGAGKPYDADTRLQDFLVTLCAEKTSDQKRAAKYYQRIADFSVSGENWVETREPFSNYIGYLALKKNGQEQAIDDLVERWKASADSLKTWNLSAGSSAPGFQWAVAKIRGNEKQATELEKTILADDKLDKFKLFLQSLEISH